MRLLWLLLVAAAAVAVRADEELEYETDEGITILTDKNFDAFIKANPTTLVKFYAPWCGHCKTLAPEYEKAAGQVPTPLAKVDATIETELAKRFDIQGFPTLKFWKDGQPMDYDGPRDAQGIVEWIMPRVDPSYKPPPEEVVALTEATFDAFLEENDFVVVKFYAPWCGHCKKIAPEYEKAAKQFKAQGKAIKLAKVDATVEKELGKKFDIGGYPTMKMFRKQHPYTYDGPRDAAGIVKYLLEQSRPAAQPLASLKEVERFMQKDDVTVIGFFEEREEKELQTFVEAAELARSEEYKMGYTSDPSVFAKFDAKPNDVIIFYPAIFSSKFEPKTRTYHKVGGEAENIVSFLREHCRPLVGKRTKKNVANRYHKNPLVVVYYNADFSLQYREGSEYWRQKIIPFATKYQKDKYNFAVSDEEEFADELAAVGLGDSGLEHNVIVFGYDGKKYPMDADEFDGELDENLAAFMKKISSGKAKPFVKSAPLPRNNNGPLKAVVASTFDKIVLDETKDVLIEFYAPWCGHCKAFEPKYEQLAAELAKTEPNLVLAKFDATANDAPADYPVQGFPTIFFAPKGGKKAPIQYTGNRDLDDLKKFMGQHSVASFRGAKKETKEEL